MSIDDRDYMRNRGRDPGKDWYNPKEFRGRERIQTRYPTSEREQKTRTEEKIEVEKNESQENINQGRENFNLNTEPKYRKGIPIPPRGWIDTGSGYESSIRPWLKHLFLWLLIGLAISKAIQFNQERIAQKEQERQAAIWQEQQRQQEARKQAERTYQSPYAKQYAPAQRTYAGTQNK